MSSRRTLILIAAIVLGGLAAFALYSYVDGVEERAYDNARRVKVFVVAQDVGKGFPGESAIAEEYVSESEIPQQFRPATAIVDVEEIRGKVALNDLSAGQVIVNGMFVDPRQAFVSFSGRIQTGRVAITVSTDDVRGVAGLLVPGDRVNMIVDNNEGAKQFLFQNVEILAIGNQAAPDLGETEVVANPGSGLLTLSVPPLAAQKLALVGNEMYLTLVPPDNVPVEVPPVSRENLFDGSLTPYDGEPEAEEL